MNPGGLLDLPDEAIAAMVAVLDDERIAADRAAVRAQRTKAS